MLATNDTNYAKIKVLIFVVSPIPILPKGFWQFNSAAATHTQAILNVLPHMLASASGEVKSCCLPITSRLSNSSEHNQAPLFLDSSSYTSYLRTWIFLKNLFML